MAFNDWMQQVFNQQHVQQPLTAPVQGPAAPQQPTPMTAFDGVMATRMAELLSAIQQTAQANAARARLGQATPDLGNNHRMTYGDLPAARQVGVYPESPTTYDNGFLLNPRGWYWAMRHPGVLSQMEGPRSGGGPSATRR